MVTTRENLVVITRKKMLKSKHTDTKDIKSYKKRQQIRKERTIDLQNNQEAINKMATVSPYLSIITLNINELNSPIKRH